MNDQRVTLLAMNHSFTIKKQYIIRFHVQIYTFLSLRETNFENNERHLIICRNKNL